MNQKIATPTILTAGTSPWGLQQPVRAFNSVTVNGYAPSGAGSDMASSGGITRNFSLAADVRISNAEAQRLGLFVSTLVKQRAFPSHGVGRDENNRPYSAYSTKPIYVSKKSPPRKADMPAPRGGAPLKRKTKKAAKTAYYPGGYSQYRASIGRSSGRNKNLFLTGQTARALTVLDANSRRIIIGFNRRRDRAMVLDSQYHFMGLTSGELTEARRYYADIVAGRMRR